MRSSTILLEAICEADKTPLVLKLITYVTCLEQKLDAMDQAITQLNQTIEALQTQAHALQEKNDLLIAENKTLKKLPQKPKITPSDMNKDDKDADKDKKDPPTPGVDANGNPKKKNKNHKKRRKNINLDIHETRTIDVVNLPEGAIFKGYKECIIQDLVIKTHNVKLQLARYRLLDGSYVTAAKPLELGEGQFGAALHAFIDVLHYEGRVTHNRIHSMLASLGVDISAGQVSNCLTQDRDAFHDEKAKILEEGLLHSSHIQVDDTQAKHDGQNGYALSIGNEHLSWFSSSETKNRLNFLGCLNQGREELVLNEHAFAYLVQHNLAKKYMNILKPGTFQNIFLFLDYLESCGLTSEHHCQVMTEAALLGSLFEQGLFEEMTILSDDAGQFSISDKNALCWIHSERPLKKLVAVHPQNATEITLCLTEFWNIYSQLKAYKLAPTASHKADIETQFDAFCRTKRVSSALTSVINKLKSNRKKLLLVLDHPDIPLHNNGAESDIREYVMWRKISGSTRSEMGRMCRDTFVSLKKTCAKLNIRFWDFLIDRHIKKYAIPLLSLLVKNALIVSKASRTVTV